MKDRRQSKDRFVYYAHGDEYTILTDYHYKDELIGVGGWDKDFELFEISEFCIIKPTLRPISAGLLNIEPVLMKLYEPISGVITHTNITFTLRDGKLHKDDGPALVKDGLKSWYLEGIKYSMEEFWEKQKTTKYAVNIMAQILGSNAPL